MTVRRDFLAFTAGAVAARTVLPLAVRADEGKGAPAGAPNPDAALIAACERHPALYDAWLSELLCTTTRPAAWIASWEGESPAGTAYNAGRAVIAAAAQPQTMAGLMAKARAALVETARPPLGEPSLRLVGLSSTDQWARDVLHDLVRLESSGVIGGAP